MGRPKGSKNKVKTVSTFKTKKHKKVAVTVEPTVKQKKVKEPKSPKLTVTRIICVKCGDKKTTTKVAMDKLIALFGSIEDVHSKYHCMKCRKEYNVRKDGKPKPEKKTRQPKIQFEKTEDGSVVLPKWMIGSFC